MTKREMARVGFIVVVVIVTALIEVQSLPDLLRQLLEQINLEQLDLPAWSVALMVIIEQILSSLKDRADAE